MSVPNEHIVAAFLAGFAAAKNDRPRSPWSDKVIASLIKQNEEPSALILMGAFACGYQDQCDLTADTIIGKPYVRRSPQWALSSANEDRRKQYAKRRMNPALIGHSERTVAAYEQIVAAVKDLVIEECETP